MPSPDRPLEVLLVAYGPSGTRRDIILQTEHDASIDSVNRQLADTLAEDGPTADRWRAYVPRLRRWLRPDEHAGQAGLLHGDRYLLSPRTSDLEADDLDGLGTCIVVVSDGGSVTRTLALPPGMYVVGRDTSVDLRLEDRSVSGRHLQVTVAGGQVSVADLGSKNGTLIGASRIAPLQPTALDGEATVRLGGSSLRLVREPLPDVIEADDSADPTLPVIRAPRVTARREPASFSLGAPPIRAEGRRLPLLASLAPVAGGLVLFVITANALMLVFALLGPVMAGASIYEERRSGGKRYERDAEAFRTSVAKLVNIIRDDASLVAAERVAALPGPTQVVEAAATRGSGIWQRRPDDHDFLLANAGTARQSAGIEVTLAAGGDRELRVEAAAAIAQAMAVDLPVALDLREIGALGICGSRPHALDFARWLVAQAAVHHSPRELWIAAVVPATMTEDWDALKWLPHTRPRAADPHLTSLLGGSDETNVSLLDRLTKAGQAKPPASRDSAVLAVIDEPEHHDQARVDEVLALAESGAIAAICVAADRRRLPGRVRAIIDIKTSDEAQLVTSDTTTTFKLHGVSRGQMRTIGLALAPLRDAAERTAESEALPAMVLLPALIGLTDITAEVVAGQWQ